MLLRKGTQTKTVRDDASAQFLQGLKQGGWKIDSAITDSLDKLDAEAKAAADKVVEATEEEAKAAPKPAAKKAPAKKKPTVKKSVNE